MKQPVIAGSIELSDKLPPFLWTHFWSDEQGRGLHLWQTREAYKLSMVLPTFQDTNRDPGFRLQHNSLSETGQGSTGQSMGSQWPHPGPINAQWLLGLRDELQSRGVPSKAAVSLTTQVATLLNAMTTVNSDLFGFDIAYLHFPKDWIGSLNREETAAEVTNAG